MTTATIDVVDISQDLKDRRAWVTWRAEARAGRIIKPPYNPQTGRLASCADPATWASFEEALAACQGGDFDGIGFQLGPPFVGIDLDHCRDPETGVIRAEAMAIIDELDSYTEVSPSGEGVHILVKGELPAGGRRTTGVELYDRDRYFTVTGNHVAGTPVTIEPRNAELATLHARLFGGQAAPPVPLTVESRPARPTASPLGKHASAALTDEELIAKMMSSGNGQEVGRLWAGDWQGKYPSQSEADLAFCANLAFWTGKDPERMDRLFRQSQLFRSKWDELRGSRTYGETTVATAIWRVPGMWTARSAPARSEKEVRP